MDEASRSQSSWSRAKSDTQKAFHTARFWAAEVIAFAIGGAISGAISDNPWVGAGGAVITAFSLVGFLFVVSLVLAPYRQRDEARQAIQATSTPQERPVLQFRDPRSDPSEIFTMTWRRSKGETQGMQVKAQLWRVELANTVPDTLVTRVRVRLESDPPLAVFPVSVHEKHDNDSPYKSERDVRYGEPIEFDIFAKGIDNDNFYIFRSDMGEGYVHQLSESECEAIRARLWGNGWTLILRAVADPPAQGHIMSYRAVVDKEGTLRLEEDPGYAELAFGP